MKLNPRYGNDPVIVMDRPPAAIARPVIEQRRRLAGLLEAFTDDQWAHPSRCEGWTNRDVIVHLDSTNTFWSFSVAAGQRGEPTRFLATFDPVASPAQLVEAAGDRSPSEVLAGFLASNDQFIATLEALDEADWSLPAEAPPGHLAISAVAHHALWDAWVHERDVLAPLGLDCHESPEEIAACLRYAVALGPALSVASGFLSHQTLHLAATDPTLGIRLDIGDQVRVRDDPDAGNVEGALVGPAADLVEALSLRTPLGDPVAGAAAWTASLAAAFDADDA